MITQIRKQFKGTVSTLVIIITVLALGGAFSLPVLLRQLATGGPWAIRVNKYEVPYADFARELSDQQERINSLRAQYGQYADMLFQSMGMTVNPRQLAYETLVRESLLEQVAHQIGLYLHPDYVADQLHSKAPVLDALVPPFVFDAQGNIDQKILKNYLKRRGMTSAAFEKKLESILAAYNMTLKIAQVGVYVPTFEVRQQFVQNSLAKKFAVGTFSLDPFLKDEKKAEIPKSEIKAFYDQQNAETKRYLVPEKRSGMVWKFVPSTYGVVASDKQIADDYENNKTKYIEKPSRVEVRRILIASNQEGAYDKAVRVHAQAKSAPSTFADIAKRESDDKDSAPSGGLIAPFAKGEKEKTFERAAFILPEDGAISDVFETEQGYEILQRVSKKMPEFKSLSAVKDDIKKRLTNRLFNERFSEDLRNITSLDDVPARDAAFERFVKEHGGKGEEVPAMVLDESPLAKQLFKLDKGSYSFYIDDSTGVVVKLTAVAKQYLPSIEAIEKTVLDDLYESRAFAAMAQAVDEAKKAAQKSGDALKAFPGISFEQTDMIKSDDTKAVDALKKKGIPVDQMLMLEKAGAVITDLSEKNGYVMRLEEIEPFNEQEFGAKLPELTQQAYQRNSSLFIAGFVASLERSATIETNESLTTSHE